MSKQSAGILLYRVINGTLEVLLVHPGGPFFARRDAGVWSVPKGEFEASEDAMTAARREFKEEVGTPAPEGEYLDLGSVKSKSNKTIYAFAIEGTFDVRQLKSNTFELEWPPHSGQKQQTPEVDKAAWLTPEKAIIKLSSGQPEFIERLSEKLGIEPPVPPPEQSTLF